MLEAKIGPVIQPTTIEQKLDTTPKAPGMKYTHYAPNAPVYLIDCDVEKVNEAVLHLQRQGHRVALLAPVNFEEIKVDFTSPLVKQEVKKKWVRPYIMHLEHVIKLPLP